MTWSTAKKVLGKFNFFLFANFGYYGHNEAFVNWE